MIKTLKLTLLSLLLCVGVMGCHMANNEIRTNDFIKSHAKPIIVRYGKVLTKDGHRSMTLQSADNQVLSIEYSLIILPDTIN